jgi:hypothetical protein
MPIKGLTHCLSEDRQHMMLLVPAELAYGHVIEVNDGFMTSTYFPPSLTLQCQMRGRYALPICSVQHRKCVKLAIWKLGDKHKERFCLPMDDPEFQKLNKTRCI